MSQSPEFIETQLESLFQKYMQSSGELIKENLYDRLQSGEVFHDDASATIISTMLGGTGLAGMSDEQKIFALAIFSDLIAPYLDKYRKAVFYAVAELINAKPQGAS